MRVTRRALRTSIDWTRRNASAIGVAALATLFALLLIQWSGYTLRLLPTATIQLGGDSLLNSWSISQAIDNLAHRPLDLGYSPILYPDPAPFANTIAPYGIALVVWPFFALSGGNLVLTYNLYLIVTFPLTALAGYLLCRYLLGATRPSATLAGLLMAFAQPRITHLAHVEQLSTHLLLLTLYCLHRLVDRPRIRWAIGLAVAFWLTLLTSGYLAMAGVVAGGIVLGTILARHPHADHRRRAALLIGAAGLAAALSAPFLLYRFQNPTFTAGRSYDEIMLYSAPLEGFAAGTSLLYHNVTPDIEGELRLFLGFAPIGLSLLAWRWRKTSPEAPADPPERLLTRADVVAVYGLLTLAGFVLAVGPALQVGGNRVAPMPYLLIMQLPGFSSLRVPARFFILAVAGTSVLSAFALDRLADALARPWAGLAMAAIAVAVAAELFPFTGSCDHRLTLAFDGSCGPPPITAFVAEPIPPVYGWLAQQPPGSAVMHYPMTGAAAYDYYAYLPDQRQPMLNGEGVSFFPDWFRLTDWSAFPDLRTMVLLKQRGIKYVVVHQDLLTAEQSTKLQAQWSRFEATWGKIPLVKQFGSDSCYAADFGPVRSLRIEFDERLPGEGWGEPETGTGKTFQWMGDRASLLLPLAADAPLKIQFRTYSALQDESLRSLRLWVDGRLIRLDSQAGDDGATIFEGTIPQAALAKGGKLTTLKFVTRGAARPIDLGQGSDTRLLAVALDWLVIGPAGAG